MKKIRFLFMSLLLTMAFVTTNAQSYYEEADDGSSVDVTWNGDRLQVWLYDASGKMVAYGYFTPDGRAISINGNTMMVPILRKAAVKLIYPNGDVIQGPSTWVWGDSGSCTVDIYDADAFYETFMDDCAASSMRSYYDRAQRARNDVMSTCQ